jgi:hypothetical protein
VLRVEYQYPCSEAIVAAAATNEERIQWIIIIAIVIGLVTYQMKVRCCQYSSMDQNKGEQVDKDRSLEWAASALFLPT